MKTKRIRIIVSVNTNGDVDVRQVEASLFATAEARLAASIRASRELMSEVWPEYPHETHIVVADVPVPEVAHPVNVIQGEATPVANVKEPAHVE